MQWTDEGVILGTRRHGENSVIAEVMTRGHGRHLGLVRSGRSRAMQPVLQPGNLVELTWRARLEEHLGDYKIEPLRSRAAGLMESAVSVYGVQALAALLRLLPERDPHIHLYETLNVILDNFDTPVDACELYVRFEVAMLNDLGFGLDLARCAATGTKADLIYVSPKTGRAVSRVAGEPYADKMLKLPAFLSPEHNKAATGETIADAFAMTGYFLERHVYEPRGLKMADARAGLRDAAIKVLMAAKVQD
ncbi:DNA repair protein RecO [Rhizobium sp. L1K21]|uniref:DNA repair protein RecO n=1 Tax=Rhizobium sp. L1K21 TaxID=2954933 RepID=UPI002093D088|nr:DNA repair protein RecO [Rhizobium sp. L1K21]MCO6186586.1 DNA repair protein RecO [Rhizobium sp. L1K21]